MRIMPLHSLSVMAANERVYVLVREGKALALKVFDKNLVDAGEITRIEGGKGFILNVRGDKVLVGVDNKLLLIEGGKAETVLTAGKLNNFFWHATEAKGQVFVHEYGEPPTSIFVSKNLKDWEKVVSNLDIDKSSRHFHYIVYDPYREWILATLGDGCLTRVAVSEDLGSTWRPLYKGPWQFVPIVPLKDIIVFGMDSGIARGGVGIYHPNSNRWKFYFFKWRDKRVSLAQMCDLKHWTRKIWISAFAQPQAIASSTDLNTWYPIYLESYEPYFNPYMTIALTRELILCSTGRNLVVLNKGDLRERMQSSDPVATPYGAVKEKLIGLGFVIKRLGD